MILDNLLRDKPTEIFKKLLEINSLNHKVISNNIANVETPGYTAKKLEFGDAMKEAVKSDDPERIAEVTPEIKDNEDTPYRMDMNNVDVEKELLALEENRMQYETIGALLKKRISKWATIAQGIK